MYYEQHKRLCRVRRDDPFSLSKLAVKRALSPRHPGFGRLIGAGKRPDWVGSSTFRESSSWCSSANTFFPRPTGSRRDDAFSGAAGGAVTTLP